MLNKPKKSDNPQYFTKMLNNKISLTRLVGGESIPHNHFSILHPEIRNEKTYNTSKKWNHHKQVFFGKV